MTWVSAVRSSSIGTTSWSSGIGRPSRITHHQRHRRDLHRLGDLRRRVDVDQAGQEPALELAGQRGQVVGELRRSRASGCGE